MRHFFYEGFVWFVAAYRTAAEKLQGRPGPEVPGREWPAGAAVRQQVGWPRFLLVWITDGREGVSGEAF